MAELKKIKLGNTESTVLSEADVQDIVSEYLPDQATDDTLGTIKINSAEGIRLNDDGQLEIDGLVLGQTAQGGIYYKKDRQPRSVGDVSFLMTDALGMELSASRSFGVLSGIGVSISGAHAAGVTEYKVANTYANRILCSTLKYMSLDEATSKVETIVPVVSVTINGVALTPDSSANDTNSPIVIKVAETLNPDAPLANGRSIRGFGAVKGGYASVLVGSGVGQDAGGANFLLGQGVFSKSGNMNVALGQYLYNQGNGNALVGRWHISKKNRWFMAGSGHDNTSGRAEAGAVVGQYSRIDANTLFAVGNGASQTDRKNAFEVQADGMVLPSPDGTRWKIKVDNNGNLTTERIG